jgi:hypothetical protein
MKRIYTIGSIPATIDLQVDVGTIGTAYSLACKAASGGQRNDLAQSTVTSNGNIARTKIGTNTDLCASYVVIYTTIDFGDDPTKWAPDLKNLSIDYHFWGGFSGHQTYNFDTDDIIVSANGKIVVITKPIQMQ